MIKMTLLTSVSRTPRKVFLCPHAYARTHTRNGLYFRPSPFLSQLQARVAFLLDIVAVVICSCLAR